MQSLYHKKPVKIGLTAMAIIIVLGIVMPQKVMAQDSDKVYTVVDKMPEIKGGLPALYKKIEYPKKAVKKHITGRVFLQVIVDKKGNPKNAKVIRDIGGGCGQAAVDAISKMKFKPGKKNGEKVKVKYSLPITFRIKDK